MSLLRSAEILAVGSELLTPFRSDTNSLYLTAQLNELGIDVRHKGIVGDDAADIRDRFLTALANADLIVICGGLGPTGDDLTRETVAESLGLPLAQDASVLAAIQQRFERRGLRMPAGNQRQAAVPKGAIVLANPNGTAPGLWIEHEGKIVVLLPGPPRELQHIFSTEVRPRLEKRTEGQRLLRRVLKITGLPESHVDDIAQPIYLPWRDGKPAIETTILASPGQIELHLSSRGTDVGEMERALESAVNTLAAAIGLPVFSRDGRSMEEVVGGLLSERGWRLAVAESCTGGLVGGRITEVPGSSAWFAGGVVAYADEIKERALGVPADLLRAHGAVSEPVARAMADGVRQQLGTDVGLSITGVAGPGGGSAEKPVGMVVVGVSCSATHSRTFKFPGDRQMVRQQSVMAALELLRRTLIAL